MKGLGRWLRSGTLTIEPDFARIKIVSDSQEDFVYFYEMKESDWGFVYEKYVAQVLTNEGYDVLAQGLEKGFCDCGIDLIAKKSGSSIFIQCKFTAKSKLSHRKIESILYKTSSFLAKIYEGEKLEFWLVVPSLEKAFSSKKSPLGRNTYPVADYFLSKNTLQSKVRLSIREIEMVRY
ncbi:MAG: restriction endonuclease [Pseudomonadota bacterium]|nr:restriction endonuclease [Pseudomonadota bacterium]